MTAENIEIIEPEKVGCDLIGKFTADGSEVIGVAVSRKGLAIRLKAKNGKETVEVIF